MATDTGMNLLSPGETPHENAQFLLFLCAVFFPNARLYFFFLIPMKMPIAVIIYIAIEIFSQIYGLANGVAHLIHLSGVLIGWLYVMVRFRMNPIKIWRDAL